MEGNNCPASAAHIGPEGRRRRLGRAAGATACLVAGTVLWWACTPRKTAAPAAPLQVKTLTVSRSATATMATYVGTVEEADGSLLSFATTGTVAGVLADEGQAVRQGQVLAVLDKSTARNSHDMALSTLRQMQDAFRRMDALYKKGSLPEVKHVEIQTQLAQAEAAERIARKSLADCVLRAPFGGYIAQRSIDAGNNVGPGMGCFRLVKIDNVKVKISVPEKEISTLHDGMAVQLSVAALGGRQFRGIVEQKGVQANALSHTYEVKARVANKDHALLPGMVASVTARRLGSRQAIVVPQATVLVDGQGSYVWVVDHGRVHRRSVTTGELCDQGVVVADGLADGEQIVTDGLQKVSEGAEVRVP
jgi:membrane fusion protein (multidrug efflux system)